MMTNLSSWLGDSKPEFVSFPVQTLVQLRSAGYARRRSFVFTPPDSPTPSSTGELVVILSDCHQSLSLTLDPTSIANLIIIDWESSFEASFALRCFQRL